MPFTLSEVDPDKDFPELIACQWESYESPNQPFIRVFCPILGSGPNARAESLQKSTALQLAWHRVDPSSHWQKVTDSETGRIAGGALWKIYESNPFAETKDVEPDWYPEGSRRAFVKETLKQFGAPRATWARRPHLCKYS